MPRTPLVLGAGADRCLLGAGAGVRWVEVAETGARLAERLTVTSLLWTTARFGATAFGFGLALTTPTKAIVPKVSGTSGAWAADGFATSTAGERERATGAAAFTAPVSVAAEAGRAREATMAPEIAMTAEVLVAGAAVSEMADAKDDAGLSGLGAR